MATTPAQLPITELDYDQILSNLIDFMKADPTFSDYDFTGSGLRLLSRVPVVNCLSRQDVGVQCARHTERGDHFERHSGYGQFFGNLRHVGQEHKV